MLFLPLDKDHMIKKNSSRKSLEQTGQDSSHQVSPRKKIKVVKTKKGAAVKQAKPLLPAYKAEDLKLPKRFAEQVLELEMNVEHNVFTLKQVQRLMALYSKAVEFYNGKSDGKYLYYQDKIQNLITQQKVLDMLSSKANTDDSVIARESPRTKTDPKTKEELKKKERILKMNLHMSNQEQEKKGVKAKIIEEHVNDQDMSCKIIESNLDEQKSMLAKRLEERRKRMQKEQPKPSSADLTNSSTPNVDSSKKESHETAKSNSSGDASVENEDECVFQLNLNSLADQGFSDELMNRLRLLQDGYDDNDYDDDKLFDDDAYEEEIEKILTKCDEEVENLLQQDSSKLEKVYEEVADERFEKLADLKAEYKYLLKKAKNEEEKEELIRERDAEIKVINNKYDEIKNQRISELKSSMQEKMKIKKENIKKVRRSISRKASRRASRKRTPTKYKDVSNLNEQAITLSNFAPTSKQELNDNLSKGIANKKEFSSSFKMPKGPINMNNLVAKADQNESSP